MSEANSSIVSTTREGDVAVITMDDGKANALSPQMIEELTAAVESATKEAKAIVLAGREGRFCAGFDLKIMMRGPDAARDLVTSGGALLLTLYETRLPVVVACTGHAIAGGVLLAATGDTRIGTLGSFKIGLNEVSSAMPVPVLAHEFARDRLLRTELIAATVQAKIYDPESAVAAGWLDRAVPAESLMEEALKEAKRLAALPAHAYGITKRSVRRETIKYIRDTMESNMAELMLRPA